MTLTPEMKAVPSVDLHVEPTLNAHTVDQLDDRPKDEIETLLQQGERTADQYERDLEELTREYEDAMNRHIERKNLVSQLIERLRQLQGQIIVVQDKIVITRTDKHQLSDELAAEQRKLDQALANLAKTPEQALSVGLLRESEQHTTQKHAAEVEAAADSQDYAALEDLHAYGAPTARIADRPQNSSVAENHRLTQNIIGIQETMISAQFRIGELTKEIAEVEGRIEQLTSEFDTLNANKQDVSIELQGRLQLAVADPVPTHIITTGELKEKIGGIINEY